MAMHSSEQRVKLTESEFVAAVRRRLPAERTQLGPMSSIRAIHLNKVDAAAIRTALRDLLEGPPEELIDALETLGDAYEWYASRQPEPGGEPAQLRVALRPVIESDLPALYMASASCEVGFRWRYRGATPSMADFLQQLFDGVHAQFMVVDARTGEAHGLVCAYDARFENRSVSIGFLRTAQGKGRGEVLEGSLLLIEYLFRHWDFRKIYAEVPAYNAEGMFDLESKIVRVEGRLVDHWFFDGRWWDQLIIAVWREDWMSDVAFRPLVAADRPRSDVLA